jgi:hypothetical protein
MAVASVRAGNQGHVVAALVGRFDETSITTEKLNCKIKNAKPANKTQ